MIWLLAIASTGVWITFFIGRINIGQGAFALAGGYVSAILVSTLWILVLADHSARRSLLCGDWRAHWPPNPQIARR